MITVVGLDLSLVCTGVAVITHNHTGQPPLDTLNVNTHLVTSRGHRTDTRATKGARIRDIRDRIMANVPRNTTLVVLEGLAYAANNPGTDERHHLWWLISDACDHLKIPLAVVAPTSLKKYITDRGNAKKAEVVTTIARLWPTTNLPTDDAADSLALATAGAQHLHLPLPFPVLERHKLALSKIHWPTTGATVKPPPTAEQDRQNQVNP